MWSLSRQLFLYQRDDVLRSGPLRQLKTLVLDATLRRACLLETPIAIIPRGFNLFTFFTLFLPPIAHRRRCQLLGFYLLLSRDCSCRTLDRESRLKSLLFEQWGCVCCSPKVTREDCIARGF